MSVWRDRSVARKTSSAANPEPPRTCERDVVIAESPTLQGIATAIGEAWAHELVRALQDDEREIIGAWPGTISEARMRVLAHLKQALDLEVLAELARVATVAARREWLVVAGRDVEA